MDGGKEKIIPLLLFTAVLNITIDIPKNVYNMEKEKRNNKEKGKGKFLVIDTMLLQRKAHLVGVTIYSNEKDR